MKQNKLSTEVFLERYQKGERHFLEIEMEGNLRHANLEGVCFEHCSLAVDFRYANLKKAKFIYSDIKTCDSREADLRMAHFEELSVEATRFAGAQTEGLVFNNNYFSGVIVEQEDFEVFFKFE